MQRTRADAETSLGTMYELFREEAYSNVNIIRPFGIATIRKDWHAFSAQYIDTTEMTFETIDVEAARIVAERPTFRLFENNCQNFVKFLLEALCPGVSLPDTIHDIVQRLNDVSTIAKAYGDLLPGAYPASVASSTCTSFVTATGTTWLTASGDTWATALEYFSSSDSTHSQGLTGVPLNGAVNRNPILKIVERTFRGKTSIIRAVNDGDVDKVAALIRINADLSVSDKATGQTPLHIAVERDDPVILKMLLDAHANPSVRTSESGYEIGFIKRHSSSGDIVFSRVATRIKMLLTFDNRLGDTPLHLAVKNGNMSLVEMLLNAHADPSAENLNGETPLHVAVKRTDVNATNLLLQGGSKPSAQNWQSYTPLHLVIHGQTSNALANIPPLRISTIADSRHYKYAASILSETRRTTSLLDSGVSTRTERAKQTLIAQMLIDAHSNFSTGVYGDDLAELTPWHMATTWPGTSFQIIQVLLNSGVNIRQSLKCRFMFSEAFLFHFGCVEVQIRVDEDILWRSGGRNRIESTSVESSNRQVMIYAGNLETLDSFYQLWWSSFGESSYQWPGRGIHPFSPNQIPFVLHFKGTVRGRVGPSNWAIYNEEMVMLGIAEAEYGDQDSMEEDYGDGPGESTSSEDGRIEMAKIWINEKYHLEMEVKDGKRWLTPVLGNVHEDRDFKAIWTEAEKSVVK